MAALVALLAVVVLVSGVAVVQLQRTHAHLTREVAALRRTVERLATGARPSEPTTGSAAPERSPAASTTPAHPTASITSRRPETAQRARLLAFLSPECTTCATFWDAFAVGVELPPDTDLDVVTEDLDQPPTEALAARISAVTDAGVTVRHDSETWRRHDVPVSPYFVLVDETGRVRAEGAANTWDLVRTILG